MRAKIIKFLGVKKAYRKLFLDEQGRLRPEAETVLDDLYEFTRWFTDPPPEAQAMYVTEGGRQVVRRILKQTRKLSAEQLRQIHQGVYEDE